MKKTLRDSIAMVLIAHACMLTGRRLTGAKA